MTLQMSTSTQAEEEVSYEMRKEEEKAGPGPATGDDCFAGHPV